MKLSTRFAVIAPWKIPAETILKNVSTAVSPAKKSHLCFCWKKILNGSAVWLVWRHWRRYRNAIMTFIYKFKRVKFEMCRYSIDDTLVVLCIAVCFFCWMCRLLACCPIFVLEQQNTSTKIFVLTTLLLLGSWGGPTWAFCVRYLAQEYLGSALKVFWHLSLPQDHLPSFCPHLVLNQEPSACLPSPQLSPPQTIAIYSY